jgi:hypothetical protein
MLWWFEPPNVGAELPSASTPLRRRRFSALVAKGRLQGTVVNETWLRSSGRISLSTRGKSTVIHLPARQNKVRIRIYLILSKTDIDALHRVPRFLFKASPG